MNELKRIKSLNDPLLKAYQVSKTHHPRLAWLDWLVKEAKHGNDEALEILRSRRANQYQGNNVSGDQLNNSSIKYCYVETITKNGTIIRKVGSTVIRDDGKRLIVLPETSSEALAHILHVAIQQYGNHLAINGTDQFRTEIAQVAVHNKMRITFDDKALEQHRQQLMKQQIISRKQKTKAKGISL